MKNFVWSKRSLANLEGIHPDLRRVCDLALKLSEHDFVIVDGLRTIEEQKHFIKIGASKTMNSNHLTGHAIDFAPWYDGGAQPKAPFELYKKIADAFKAAALELGISIIWGGDWKRFVDGPHIELDRRVFA